MRKKFMWLGLSFLLVVVLVLSSLISSCGTKTTTAPVTTSTSSTPTAATPVPGGTFTYFTVYGNQDPPSWDDVTTPSIAYTDVWMNPYAETLLKGDINKYGPRGDNSFSFQFDLVSQFGQYEGPCLATSWEVTSNPLGVVYHLRQGVMWTGNTNIGMAPRELTADDVAYHINRDLTDSALKGLYTSYIKSVTATDKYTVTIVWSTFYSQWESPIGMDDGVQARIIPPEVVKAGADNWQNQTGTGPFILTEYVSGSYATYTKNPNYWGTTTINGKTYQEPLIDTLVYPIMPDQSTAIAALRTGKIDMWPHVPLTNQSSLASTSPQLTMQKWLTNRVDMLRFNMIGSSVFNNKEIRQAMYIATDLQSIATDIFQGGDIYSFPIAPGTPEYTPVDQLPAADQALFTYDPVKAKQMIADAGYPNGFTCEVTINSSTTQWHDEAEMLVSQWAKAGVTLTIDQEEDTAYLTTLSAVSYKDSLMLTYSTDDAWAVLQAMRTGSEGCSVNDTVYNAMYDQAQATQDDASRIAQKKALGVYELDNAFAIGLVNPYNLNCYWPWVKNYYGEISAGNYSDIMPMVSQMWIDQSLKKSLGY